MLEITELKSKLQAAYEREKLKDEIIDDLKQDRDHWRQMVMGRLTDQRPGVFRRLAEKIGL